MTNGFGNNVSQYDIRQGGKLVPKRPATVPAGTRPLGVAVSPNGRSVYVTNAGAHDNVSQYNVGADGKLTPKSPATVAAGSTRGGWHEPRWRSAYVTNQGSDTISQYNVEQAAGLTPKSPATVATGGRSAAGGGKAGRTEHLRHQSRQRQRLSVRPRPRWEADAQEPGHGRAGLGPVRLATNPPAFPRSPNEDFVKGTAKHRGADRPSP